MANSAGEIVSSVKTMIDNYVNNRKLSTLLIGTYDGNAVVVNEQLAIPMEMVRNMLSSLIIGDKVKLLRNEGGQEYYIMEIIGSSEPSEYLESEGG